MRIWMLLTLLLSLNVVHAAEFGRLFFTPEQRAQMDYDYARNITTEGDIGSVLLLNGIVQRKGGKRTVWINGVPQEAGKSDERSPASVPVTVPGKTRPVEIKVGQRLLLEAPASAPADVPPR